MDDDVHKEDDDEDRDDEEDDGPPATAQEPLARVAAGVLRGHGEDGRASP